METYFQLFTILNNLCWYLIFLLVGKFKECYMILTLRVIKIDSYLSVCFNFSFYTLYLSLSHKDILNYSQCLVSC